MPFPTTRYLANTGIKLVSPALAGRLCTTMSLRKPHFKGTIIFKNDYLLETHIEGFQVNLYDFSEETLSHAGRMSEQGFTDFISIMPYVTERDSAFAQFVSHITDEKRVLRRFFDIAQKYLAEVASPVYNEPLYILFLQKLVESEKLKLSEGKCLKDHWT